MALQVLDSLIDGPLQLGNEREGNELIGMLVRYLRTGAEPDPRTDAQRMALAMVRPVLERSRARIAAGSKGGSEPKSKQASKPQSKTSIKQESKTESNGESKRQSNSYCPSPTPDSEEEEADGIPYAEIVALLNEAAGTAYRPTSRKTQQLIRARWSEGFRLGDFESVIANMTTAWKQDPKMSAYLRPETLFGTKFESYLNRPSARKEAGHDPFAAY